MEKKPPHQERLRTYFVSPSLSILPRKGGGKKEIRLVFLTSTQFFNKLLEQILGRLSRFFSVTPGSAGVQGHKKPKLIKRPWMPAAACPCESEDGHDMGFRTTYLKKALNLKKSPRLQFL